MSQNLFALNIFSLTENLSKPQVLTIVTSKHLLTISKFLPVFSFFFHNENSEFAVNKISTLNYYL